jgi:CRP/FNR family transcriptional regulator, cyclic AMP receptor protein
VPRTDRSGGGAGHRGDARLAWQWGTMTASAPSVAVSLVGGNGDAAPAELAMALLGAGDRLRARTGQMVLAAGMRADDVYVVLAGAVRVTVFSADGREVIMRDQAVGSFFGDLSAIDGGRRSASIIAVADSQLLVVKGADFRRLVLATPSAAGWFATHLVAQVRSLTDRVLELSTLNVRSRLHCQLLRLCAITGVTSNRATLDPSPTHEVLATMIGSHREAVTRELSFLASVGIVEQTRRRLEIADVERLAGLVRQVVGEATG